MGPFFLRFVRFLIYLLPYHVGVPSRRRKTVKMQVKYRSQFGHYWRVTANVFKDSQMGRGGDFFTYEGSAYSGKVGYI